MWVVLSSLETGRYIEVNDAFCKMSGYNRDEVVGKTQDELGHFVDVAARSEIVYRLKEEGTISGLEIKYRAKNGQVVDTLFSARLLRARDQVCMWRWSRTSATSRKRKMKSGSSTRNSSGG